MTDLFPGFDEHRLAGDGSEIYLRTGGSGPPLVLLHGFPQSHMMWHRIARDLAKHFTLIIPDLRGYGRSEQPANDARNETYSKRAMGRDIFKVMDQLGHERFAICGHDRGGRVGYRMALDEPSRITQLAVLDIIPTWNMWTGLNDTMAMKVYHWMFLAQPHPLPETLIGADPEFYLKSKMIAWNGRDDASAFDPIAFADYVTHFRRAETIHALCNDYRAGRTYDFEADDQDRKAGRRIECPVLALWGASGIPAEDTSPDASPLSIWQQWADDVSGGPVEAGHFLAEENPKATLDGLLGFFKTA